MLKKITERLEFLAFLHAEPPRRIDYRPLLSQANDVQIVEESFECYRYEQYSNRQKRMIPREVFLGKVLYRGVTLKDLLPYLIAAETLNVGSGMSAGLGRFEIRGQTAV